MNASKLISAYLQLKEKKSTLKAEYDAGAAELDVLMARTLKALDDIMTEQGLQNLRGDNGTAYIGTKTSASVGDWNAFLKYAVDTDRLELLGRHCSKEAVAAYREENDALPPGVNWYAEKTVNIRRA